MQIADSSRAQHYLVGFFSSENNRFLAQCAREVRAAVGEDLEIVADPHLTFLFLNDRIAGVETDLERVLPQRIEIQTIPFDIEGLFRFVQGDTYGYSLQLRENEQYHRFLIPFQQALCQLFHVAEKNEGNKPHITLLKGNALHSPFPGLLSQFSGFPKSIMLSFHRYALTRQCHNRFINLREYHP